MILFRLAILVINSIHDEQHCNQLKFFRLSQYAYIDAYLVHVSVSRSDQGQVFVVPRHIKCFEIGHRMEEQVSSPGSRIPILLLPHPEIMQECFSWVSTYVGILLVSSPLVGCIFTELASLHWAVPLTEYPAKLQDSGKSTALDSMAMHVIRSVLSPVISDSI